MEAKKKYKVVYTIVERGAGKRFWLRCGVAFDNRDGSLNVYLDSLPVNGTLQIRAAGGIDDGRRPDAEVSAERLAS